MNFRVSISENSNLFWILLSAQIDQIPGKQRGIQVFQQLFYSFQTKRGKSKLNCFIFSKKKNSKP